MNDKGEYVIVLADGETYTGWRECRVLWIPPNIEDENMDYYVKENSLDLGIEISLTSISSEEAPDRFYGDLYVPDPNIPE